MNITFMMTPIFIASLFNLFLCVYTIKFYYVMLESLDCFASEPARLRVITEYMHKEP